MLVSIVILGIIALSSLGLSAWLIRHTFDVDRSGGYQVWQRLQEEQEKGRRAVEALTLAEDRLRRRNGEAFLPPENGDGRLLDGPVV